MRNPTGLKGGSVESRVYAPLVGTHQGRARARARKETGVLEPGVTPPSLLRRTGIWFVRCRTRKRWIVRRVQPGRTEMPFAVHFANVYENARFKSVQIRHSPRALRAVQGKWCGHDALYTALVHSAESNCSVSGLGHAHGLSIPLFNTTSLCFFPSSNASRNHVRRLLASVSCSPLRRNSLLSGSLAPVPEFSTTVQDSMP